jgi:type IV pilus assembly protein PilB
MECNRTGYKGRSGLFEIFVVDDTIRKMINDKVSSNTIRHHAREIGMRTLREDGIRKVLSGTTTPQEVLSATMAEMD